MTIKVHGAAYPGIWVERQVVFVKVTFTDDIGADDNYSAFGVVESCIVQALKYLETRGTVLGVSAYDPDELAINVMLGFATGWFSDDAGLVEEEISVTGAAQDNTMVPPATLPPLTTKFKIEFAAWKTMPVATAADGDLKIGPGATSGATPPNSPTGTPGYYPVELDYNH